MIAVVLLRTLHRDILKHNKLATAEDAAERRAGNSFTLTCSGNLIIPCCLQYVLVRVLMNVYSLLENNSDLAPELVEQIFDGNLSCCADYRPIPRTIVL